MSRTPILAALTAATIALPLAASASSIIYTFPDFSNPGSLLTFNADAQQNGSEIDLTQPPDMDNFSFGAGSIFTATTIDLGADRSFSTVFSFRFTDSGVLNQGAIDTNGTTDPSDDNPGADGIVFVVRNAGTGVGTGGVGIGYDGIETKNDGIGESLGVEFDTWYNWPGFFGGVDESGNHVAINTDGQLNGALGYSEVTEAEFTNEEIWYAWVDFDGVTDTFEVRLSQSELRPNAPLLSANVALEQVIGTPDAFLGFTSATGDAWSRHSLLSWQFINEYRPILKVGTFVDEVPAPAALPLLAIGGLLAGLARRRA